MCKVIFCDMIFVSSNEKVSFLSYFDTTLNFGMVSQLLTKPLLAFELLFL